MAVAVMVGVAVKVDVAVGVADGVRVLRGGRGVDVTVAVAVGLEGMIFAQPGITRIMRTIIKSIKLRLNWRFMVAVSPELRGLQGM